MIQERTPRQERKENPDKPFLVTIIGAACSGKSTVLDADKLYVYKAINEPSVSVCFVPASKATRDKADDANTPLKNLGITGGVPTQVVACSAAPTDWSDLSEACFVCIPEE